MELWQLYLLFTIPGFAGWFGALSFLLVLAGIVVSVYLGMINEPNLGEKPEVKKEKRSLQRKGCRQGAIIASFAIFTSFVAVMIPSSKEMTMIIGGYFATNIEGVEELPPNIVKAANKFLEKIAEDPPEVK